MQGYFAKLVDGVYHCLWFNTRQQKHYFLIISIMVNRLPSWVFIAFGLLILGAAQLPLVRVILGIEERISIPFLTMVMLLIAGLMCALTGMLLLVKRQPNLELPNVNSIEPRSDEKSISALMHLSGLLLFTGIPLLNFLLLYWLWVRKRESSAWLDLHGKECACFQIAIYLYILMSLFVSIIGIGLFLLMILFFYLAIASIIGAIMAAQGKVLRYPANISIIDRGMEQHPHHTI